MQHKDLSWNGTVKLRRLQRWHRKKGKSGLLPQGKDVLGGGTSRRGGRGGGVQLVETS